VYNRKVDDAWFVVRRAPVNLFRRGDDLADLLARVEAERYGVVIFDTLQRMSAGADLNLPRDATLVIDALDRVRQATGGSAGYVAHTGKSGIDVRGASNLEDDADIVWRLERDEGGDVVTAELQKRKDGPSGLKVKLRGRPAPGTGSLYLESAHGFIALDTEPKRALPIIEELDRRTADHGLSLTALAEAIGLKGKGGVIGPVDWLTTKGFVRPEQSGRYPVYKITEAGSVRLAELRGK
jgi:AAA domain